MGSAKYKENHKKRGLCIYCSEKAEHGHFCNKHAYSHNMAARNYYKSHMVEEKLRHKKEKQERIKKGLCPCCGNDRDDKAFAQCINCRIHLFRKR
jgi:hypothetical protein